MKKIFAGLLLSGIAICHVSGQTALEGNKFSDNWSIGINVGGVTPLTHHSFFKNMRSAVGVHVSKHLTPTFGLGFEAMGYFNTTKSKTAFDESNVSLLGLVNLIIFLEVITVFQEVLRLRLWLVLAGCIIMLVETWGKIKMVCLLSWD